MIDIHANTIPHQNHRYPTVGDYYHDGNTVIFHVSDMGNKDYEFLVLLHEMIEQHLTERAGIREEDITAYDEEYEANRTEESLDEPGDNPDAPYYQQHQIATAIERMVAAYMGVDWNIYDDAVGSL